MGELVSIRTIPEFDRRVKRLAKKYPSMKQDLLLLLQVLQNNPTQGVFLGNRGVYKIRIAVKSKGGGKSGGARVITYVIEENEPHRFDVTLLTIYDKSEIENISDAYIRELINEL